MPTLPVSNQSTFHPSLPFSLFVSAFRHLLLNTTTLSQHSTSLYLPLSASLPLPSHTHSTSNRSPLNTSLASSSFASASSTLHPCAFCPSKLTPTHLTSLRTLLHLFNHRTPSSGGNSLTHRTHRSLLPRLPPFLSTHSSNPHFHELPCTFSITVLLPLAVTHSLTKLIDLSSCNFLHFSLLTAPIHISVTHSLFPLSYSIYHGFLLHFLNYSYISSTLTATTPHFILILHLKFKFTIHPVSIFSALP